jgi:hypothetical protein
MPGKVSPSSGNYSSNVAEEFPAKETLQRAEILQISRKSSLVPESQSTCRGGTQYS